jgi:putative transposase
MQEQDLKARERRRYKCTTMSDHDQPVADNLLARRFEADVPNQRWVGDTTELRIPSRAFWMSSVAGFLGLNTPPFRPA